MTEAKLTRYLRWLGHDTKHFNVGKVSSIEKQTDFQLNCPKPESMCLQSAYLNLLNVSSHSSYSVEFLDSVFMCTTAVFYC